MRILHVCMACTYTEGFNYQENLLSKYHAKENETYLITNQYMFSKGNVIKSNDSEYINDDNVHVIRVLDLFPFLPHKINFYIGIYIKLYGALENIAPDIIFIHNIQFNSIRAIAKYAKRNPSVVIYADNHADFSNSGTNVVSRVLLKTEWRRCAQIINPYVKKFYGVLPARVDFLRDVYHLPREKCELLVMGADDDLVDKTDSHTRMEIRKKYGIKDDDFLIITGGKIDLAKTQTINLMEAVKKIGNPKLKLIVFGSVATELEDKVDSLIDSKRIIYEPWLSGEQSYLYFGASDLAAFPGRHSVYWEQAAGQGIPLMCKYWEGTTHVDCGGNVIFLYEDNVDEIIEKLNEIISDPIMYQNMKKISLEKAMKVFSYRNISKRSIS